MALSELSNATTDMDASLWELRAPLETERLEERLNSRARELAQASPARIAVTGSAPPLPGWISTHVYRIASEALTNALRHSSPSRVDVALTHDDGTLAVRVTDNGSGLHELRERSSGLASMTERAAAIDATLAFEGGPDGRGTVVRLDVPVPPRTNQFKERP
jgi:signal transduction histidine kinase